MRWFVLILLFQANVSYSELDQSQLINADSDKANWLTHGRTYAEERQSPLTQINLDNVNQLGLAWYFDTGTRRGLDASPIVVNGVIYTRIDID